MRPVLAKLFRWTCSISKVKHLSCSEQWSKLYYQRIIVGWAFSGVVGGFVYDLLKRLYGDKKVK